MADNDWQNGYSAGYQNGFEAGYQKGKSEGQKSPYSIPQQDWLKQYNIGTTCHTCGMFFEAGKAYGYVCPHSHCPSKAYCTTTPLTTGVTPGSCVSTTTAATWTSSAASGKPLSDNGQWGSWMTGRPMTSTNTTPDGLSYEEIYGSVVYQQGRKST